VRRARDLSYRLVRELDQPVVERDRLDVPDALPGDLDVLLPREPLARLPRELEQAPELGGLEVTLVEQLLGRLDDGGDDARPAHDAAGRAHRALADLGRDRPDLERELRGAGERVAALVHRSRAGVGGLAAPRD
jgi:hypothetical protein